MHTQSKIRRHRILRRKGAIAVVFALILIPLLLFVALSIDIGWISKSKSELQNVADAAASAGARQLIDSYGAYAMATASEKENLLKNAKDNAARYVVRYGQFNDAGGVKSLSIQDTDIHLGFTDVNGNFDPLYSGYPNTVEVLTRLDSASNSPLRLFFGGVTGKSNQPLTATASSTIFTGLINSFDPNGSAWGDDYGGSGNGSGCSLLPVAFDVNAWTQFLETGESPDGTMHTNSNGASQIQIYPSPENAPGNFGLLCIGNWTNSNNEYRNWIVNGPSSADIQALIDSNQLPVSLGDPKAFKGSPGLRSSLQKDFESIIGQPRLLPLFEPASTTPYQAASGAGSNASYKIVAFVGVSVTAATGHGNSLDISVTPCDVMDPTAVFDPSSVYPAGAQPVGQLKSFAHTVPKLTK